MDDLTNEQKLILDECRILLKEHRQLCEESERTGINNDNETDELYSRYRHLIHDNFDLELLKKTERRAGHGSFMEPEYIDTLIEVIKEQPKKICTYRGYELIRGIDCWGNISYARIKTEDSTVMCLTGMTMNLLPQHLSRQLTMIQVIRILCYDRHSKKKYDFFGCMHSAAFRSFWNLVLH